MDPSRARNDASGSRPNTGGKPARKPRKKPKATQLPAPPVFEGPMTTPYLAVAPCPVSSLSASRIDELATSSSRSQLVLPSSYIRSNQSSSPAPGRTAQGMNAAGQNEGGRRKGYAAGLLSPPAIMPGGQSLPPRVQGTFSPLQNPRKRSAERVGVGGTPDAGPSRRRSEERLRDIGRINASMMSLGVLGQIMESDPATDPSPAPTPAPAPQRRRRRIVRGDDGGGSQRRLTVSTREEGRALGVARGASMRRTNVWDDLPESNDPPPAFPFPTSATNRLPPSFATAEESVNLTSDPSTPTGRPPVPFLEQPHRSPPPTFDQAIGLLPLPHGQSDQLVATPAAPSRNNTITPISHRPSLSLSTSGPPLTVTAASDSSPTSTHYASAPTSPAPSVHSAEEMRLDDEERVDRKWWNMDLLAGYTLNERVRREIVRRMGREEGIDSATRTIERRDEMSSEETRETLVMESSDQAMFTAGGSTGSTSQVVPTSSTAFAANSSSTAEEGHSSRVHERPDEIPPQTSPPPLESTEDTGSPSAGPTTPKAVQSTTLSSAQYPTSSASPRTPRASTYKRSRTSPKTRTEIAAATNSPLDTNQSKEEETSKTPSPTAMDSISQSGSDNIIAESPPSRKLTRGKAIRRSSSNATTNLSKASSVRSIRSPQAHKPLFSSPGYTAAEVQASPDSIRVNFAHRISAPAIVEAQSGKEEVAGSPRPIRTRLWSQPNLALGEVSPTSPTSPTSGLPPHREAALKRRELALARVEEGPLLVSKSNPTSPVKSPYRPLLPSGPLIDLNENWSPPDPNTSPSAESRPLLVTTAELLELFDTSSEPAVAESSAQGAAKAAIAAAIAVAAASGEIDPSNMAASISGTEEGSPAVAPRKKAPPPPPPALRTRSSRTDMFSPVKRKPSVLSTATSPITPQPSTATRSPSGSSQTFHGRAPSMPTRRPPPPPPLMLSEQSPSPASESPPPPLHPRDSYTSTSPTSSISEKPWNVLKPPIPWSPRSRTALGTRPKGPRPPPVPPRPWARVVSDSLEVERPRPLGDRTHSENPLVIHANDTDAGPTTRSASAQEVRSSGDNAQSPVEYTDLDVLVSRLEGSGREYEGFAQIASFLGPGKDPAATSAALSTLLPALIMVDSRRTTSQGKVKLKLSLLGVRVTKCPICLSQFKDKDRAVMLPECGHVAHENCANRWFRENGKCFVCRVALRDGDGVV